MKIFALSLLGWAQASHFRAVGYTVIQGDPGEVIASRTLTFRQSSDGYSGGCTADHVANQTPSSAYLGMETCTYNSYTTCQEFGGSYGISTRYIVTDSGETENEKGLFVRNNKFSKMQTKKWDLRTFH